MYKCMNARKQNTDESTNKHTYTHTQTCIHPYIKKTTHIYISKYITRTEINTRTYTQIYNTFILRY